MDAVSKDGEPSLEMNLTGTGKEVVGQCLAGDIGLEEATRVEHVERVEEIINNRTEGKYWSKKIVVFKTYRIAIHPDDLRFRLHVKNKCVLQKRIDSEGPFTLRSISVRFEKVFTLI